MICKSWFNPALMIKSMVTHYQLGLNKVYNMLCKKIKNLMFSQEEPFLNLLSVSSVNCYPMVHVVATRQIQVKLAALLRAITLLCLARSSFHQWLPEVLGLVWLYSDLQRFNRIKHGLLWFAVAIGSSKPLWIILFLYKLVNKDLENNMAYWHNIIMYVTYYLVH